MTNYYVSLINKQLQPIPPNRYTLLHFADDVESSDEWNMHNGKGSEESGLIYPCADGIGILEANIFWEAADYTKVCDRFDRNPLTDACDPTGYDHRNPCPDMQCITKLHTLLVFRDTPLGIRVRHNAPDWVNVTQAQFKLTIMQRGTIDNTI